MLQPAVGVEAGDGRRRGPYVRVLNERHPGSEKLRVKLAAGVGIGHAPISWAGFIKSKPMLVTMTKISGEELEGYNYYRNRNIG